MKKILSVLLASAVLMSVLFGCGSEDAGTSPAASAGAESSVSAEAEPEEETAAEGHYPVTITTYNYAKEQVEETFDSCPGRVVCTNQTQTEIMLYFGLDDYIVGTAYLDGDIREDLQAQYDRLVQDGKELTVVGYPDKETVLNLEPDFIFGWRSAFADDVLGDVSEWTDIGVGTMILRCSNNTAEDLSIRSVLDDIADIGAIFDIEEQTDEYILEAETMLEGIRDSVAELDADAVQNVLMLEYEDEGMWYAWPATCLSGSLAESAGAVNLAAEGADLSVEDIINYNPDAIIIDYYEDQYGDNYSQEEAAAAAVETLTREAALAEVPAVADGRIMGICLTDIYGGGIRIVPAVSAIYEFLYG